MLHTPTRGRVHSHRDQDVDYYTPTSAHISRFQRRLPGQGQGTIPFVLPASKPSVNKEDTPTRASHHQKNRRESSNGSERLVVVDGSGVFTRPSPQSNQSRTRPFPRQTNLTGFDIWQDNVPRSSPPLAPHAQLQLQLRLRCPSHRPSGIDQPAPTSERVDGEDDSR